MPNRLVREGFLDSEAIHALSDAAECFYHRLILAVDDAGRIDGRPEMLRAKLYPLDSRRSTSDISKWQQECIAQRLVIAYDWQSKPFLQLTKWQRNSRSMTSKFPWSDGTFAIKWVNKETRDGVKEFVMSSVPHTDGMPMPSDAKQAISREISGDGDGDGDEDVNPQIPKGAEIGFFEFWTHYPRKTAQQKALSAWMKLKPDSDLCKVIINAVKAQSQWSQWTKDNGQFIPHPATWINGKRWQDELTGATPAASDDYDRLMANVSAGAV